MTCRSSHLCAPSSPTAWASELPGCAAPAAAVHAWPAPWQVCGRSLLPSASLAPRPHAPAAACPACLSPLCLDSHRSILFYTAVVTCTHSEVAPCECCKVREGWSVKQSQRGGRSREGRLAEQRSEKQCGGAAGKGGRHERAGAGLAQKLAAAVACCWLRSQTAGQPGRQPQALLDPHTQAPAARPGRVPLAAVVAPPARRRTAAARTAVRRRRGARGSRRPAPAPAAAPA